MDITVVNADGLPDKAYLSIRAGEARKQVQFKPGVTVDLKTAPKHFVLDLFEKVSSAPVSVSDLLAASAGADGAHATLELASKAGGTIKIDMRAKVKDGEDDPTSEAKAKRTSRHQAALEAKSYLDNCGAQKVLQGMVRELLKEQPDDAVRFMMSYLQELCQSRPRAEGEEAAENTQQEPTQQEEAAKLAATQAQQNREEDLEDHGFPADGSAPLPDLSGHHSAMASVLKRNGDLYAKLEAVRSENGVSLAQCIKSGVDNKGHPMVRTVGLVAGDASCYEVFEEVFDPVIACIHDGFQSLASHPLELDPSKVSDLALDDSKVVSVMVAGSRSLSHHVRMPPASSFEDLCEAERLLSEALVSLGGDLAGEYHPLHGSNSWVPKPGGMPASVQDDLASVGSLFTAPDSPLMYSAGYGQHWPHARGVFVGKKRGLYAWVNELDHLKILSKQEGGDLKRAFERFVRAERSVSSCLKSASGCDYAWDSRRGFLNSDPASLGTAMRASVSLRIPRLGGHMRDFKAVCKRLGLQARRSSGEEGDWELSLYSLPGRSEVSQINALLVGCAEICALESRLEAGQDLVTAMRQSVQADPPASSQEANGESAQPGVPADSSEVMLDLSGRHSIAADVLRADPSIYDRLKDKQTATGIAFETCVRTCFENSGHPMIKTIGAVAGDAQCYDAFKDFFGEVIKLRHPNFAGNGHSTDLDWTKVSDQPLDPDGAGRVVSVRLRLNRNLRDIPMSPACSLEERREVERAAALALSQLQGEYFPLRGSNSYAPRPGGLSIDDEERLDGEHLLFGEPDSQVLLSSGFGREWPDARGVFVGEDRRFVAWVNESDHLRIQAMQEGADLKGVFERLCSAISTVEDSLKASGYDFSHSDSLGFLGTCPSNLGTCLAASAIIRIPLLSSRPEFRAITRKLKLQVHMGVGSGLAVADGVWEILNAERLGSTEVDQVNQVIAGCRALLQAEGRLEKGEELDSSLLD